MRTRIQKIFREGIELRQSFLEKNLDVLQDTILDIAETIRAGKKILFFGNGGSAADAQHFAAEFVNRYMIDRPPLAAIALTTDTSILTAISNDFSYDEIFEKQVKALGVNGDAAIGISTSGTSRNVLRGLETAQNKGLLTIGIGGPENSPMKSVCRHYLSVEGSSTPRVQEVHLVIGHIIVELVDQTLFQGLGSSEIANSITDD
ncbi:MAG: SIS domain-containing protein [Desulfomonilaceae bacterium]